MTQYFSNVSPKKSLPKMFFATPQASTPGGGVPSGGSLKANPAFARQTGGTAESEV
ncbi:MAG: hypothetical protein NTV34_09510 [Proteobacteria bacterium]|nr:hypothetical protein [Pseudomonadota bacterium]